MSNPVKKAALVTGGSCGIGRAVATRLADDGFAVTVHYSGNAANAQQVVDEMKARDGQVIAVQADITDATQVELLFQETADAYGRIDVAVNTAGIMPLSPIAKLDLEVFDKVIATNLRGTFLVLGQVAPFAGWSNHRFLQQCHRQGVPNLRPVRRIQGRRRGARTRSGQ
jgi:3-oxoacyl-[acyl-carrier protein] reductase